MNRATRKALGEDTLRRTEHDEATLMAKAKTVSYLPKQLPLRFKPRASEVKSETAVVNMTTMAAMHHLKNQYPDERVAILNFASAKNPGEIDADICTVTDVSGNELLIWSCSGGGFLKGSSAQEESIACNTGLYVCLVDSPVYSLNRSNNQQGLYHNTCIYSPDVPVIRDEDSGSLLETERSVDVITCPCVNAGVARRHLDESAINRAVQERVDSLLSVAAHHQVPSLVLGAFGCGVFANDPKHVATCFMKLLTRKYKDVFPRITFALLSDENMRIFESVIEQYGS
eukprot:TRINITY_DN6909_c0_g1_i1.p1 TRINITY_DN6909_c0_g1~~TRINITY_DN6909_c0_g1_i1.p1  ORF type:complete len:286 (+),score=49.32 TRINITY_DN6909_c0_g1_i1:69-926(+)